MQLALGAQPLEEEDQLQLEEDDRVDGGAPDLGVGVPDQIAHEGQVERALQVAIEVVRRDQVLQRHRRQSGPKARSFVPIIAGRSCTPAGQPKERHPLTAALPFFNRLDRFVRQGYGAVLTPPRGGVKQARKS